MCPCLVRSLSAAAAARLWRKPYQTRFDLGCASARCPPRARAGPRLHHGRRGTDQDVHLVLRAIVDQRNRRRIDVRAIELRAGDAVRQVVGIRPPRSGSATVPRGHVSEYSGHTVGMQGLMLIVAPDAAGPAAPAPPPDTSSPPIPCTTSSRRGRRASDARRRRRRRRTARPCSARRPPAVRVWLIGLIRWNSSIASSPRPSRASAITAPQRGVRVLAAVLANARQVALDVARVARHLVERRREQQHELRVAAHEIGAHGVHRALGAPRLGRARQHGPRLRQRIELALLVLHRPQRRAVVEIGAPIPVAVPRELEHAGEPARLVAIALARDRRGRAARRAARTR